MTEILNKVIVNCATGEQTIVELTAEEIAQREIDKVNSETALAQIAAEVAAKAAAKASAESKLAALGLTADEIAAL